MPSPRSDVVRLDHGDDLVRVTRETLSSGGILLYRAWGREAGGGADVRWLYLQEDGTWWRSYGAKTQRRFIKRAYGETPELAWNEELWGWVGEPLR